jgi:hypothetical protein
MVSELLIGLKQRCAPSLCRKPYIARRANLPQVEKQNQWQILRYPASTRGAFRHRHERWKRDAVDAERHEANVATRTTKSCGPGAPWLALSLSMIATSALRARRAEIGRRR